MSPNDKKSVTTINACRMKLFVTVYIADLLADLLPQEATNTVLGQLAWLSWPICAAGLLVESYHGVISLEFNLGARMLRRKITKATLGESTDNKGNLVHNDDVMDFGQVLGRNSCTHLKL